jgi:hypothetical protein
MALIVNSRSFHAEDFALVGWWGIPFGPIYTVAALATNFRR